MAKRKRPGPWRVYYRQIGEGGKASRPQVVDEKGMPVKINSMGTARLVASAPEMRDLLEKSVEDFTFWTLMLQAEHPGLAMPDWIGHAKFVLAWIDRPS